jgi:hypothetical protein
VVILGRRLQDIKEVSITLVEPINKMALQNKKNRGINMKAIQ